MTPRQTLTTELERLNIEIKTMGKLAYDAVDQSLQALNRQDLDLADSVIERDQNLNQNEANVDEWAVNVIATQQPVATDLRQVLAFIKVAVDLERIGDLAVEVAKSVTHIEGQDLANEGEALEKMGQDALAMIVQALHSFRTLDVTEALELETMDNQLDQQYKQMIHTLMKHAGADQATAPQLLQLAYIARSIERIGDHCTNISEQVLFVEKGERYDLNS
ncbi:phosphate signaling complex protein PhoU [Natribacillus halophilus]|uniref:Phosphate-specific transport system accessory protein PhoU n=1 Tax=Natribacillus halophilus TaxID=549003 RepID=A0A1G8RY16_9BACI|nr:phosphate signaling complex protein PhoU [Natribacillus halophilus]SDJ21811.1 phosphate uptake regulator, PhoU [Natribacillus halophilus]